MQILHVQLNIIIIFIVTINFAIKRRTGLPLKINPRKDSKGFEFVEDYFPDPGLLNAHLDILQCN